MAEVVGSSVDGYGVRGMSTNAVGVLGESNLGGPGVLGTSDAKPGVNGRSNKDHGVFGQSGSGTGVVGSSTSGSGVHGYSTKTTGIFGHSDEWWGVHGHSKDVVRAGVFGENTESIGGGGYGVHGQNLHANGTGVRGEGGSNGVYGKGFYGVAGIGDDTGVYGKGPWAGWFVGDVGVTGNITGNKAFRIDHPLDPANSYLNHASVESPERKNVYDGVAQLDEDGTASVALPEWFEALNGDFRYQLTAVGQAAPNLHVAEEIYENRFRIAGGEGGMKVCWQVTGSRKDAWAAANPFVVEEEKPQDERGYYLHPDVYDAPEEQSVTVARMGEERWRAMMEAPQIFEPPQVPPAMPPDVAAPDFDVGRLQQQLDELRGQLEEQRRGRMEDEIDELRRQIKKLRRQRKR
jgi:hypothetical protein